MLNIQVFQDAKLGNSVCSSQCVEESQRHNGPLKRKELLTERQCTTPEDLNLQIYYQTKKLGDHLIMCHRLSVHTSDYNNQNMLRTYDREMQAIIKIKQHTGDCGSNCDSVLSYFCMRLCSALFDICMRLLSRS